MTREEILDRIQGVVRRAIGRGDIVLTPTTTTREVVGWDSLAHVTIILEVERTFGIRLRAADIANLADVGSLVELVAARAAAKT